ncbi:MAG: preprotein translocase subunit SecY [Candidatus Atribacteria bacterium]|nr:preprotein translocase subunit SecY [Candidatus Atribacteria bacterium]
MLKSIRSIFKIPELRKRILFTLGMLVVVRIGSHIVLPGVNSSVVLEFMREAEGGGLFGFYDFFVGGALGKATLFALSIAPYFTAKEVVEWLGVFIPFLRRLQMEGDEGRQKLYKYTRYMTIVFAIIEAYGMSLFIEKIHTSNGMYAVSNPDWGFRIHAIFTLAAGAILIMYICELITVHGISNGVNVVVFGGIVSHLPNACIGIITQIKNRELNYLTVIILIFLLVLTVAITVLMFKGSRKIPVIHERREIGRRVSDDETKLVSINLIISKIEPLVIAQSVVLVPITLKIIFPSSQFFHKFVSYFNVQSWIYLLVFCLLVIFYTYFYNIIIFDTRNKAHNLKISGRLIPGVKPGIQTAKFLDNILNKITLPGAIFLAIIAVFPHFVVSVSEVSYEFAFFLGGTRLLILVSIALQIILDIESNLFMRHYNGFLRSPKRKGRGRY